MAKARNLTLGWDKEPDGMGDPAASSPYLGYRLTAPRVQALVTPSPVALDDIDREIEGVATGNVITGANTLTGAAGKDHGGIGALSIASATGLIHLTYGDVTLDTKGNYTYTRTGPMDGLPAGATDSFTYILTDSKGQISDPATMTFVLNPMLVSNASVFVPVPSYSGSNYDEIIQYKSNPGFLADFAQINGLGGDDLIENASLSSAKIDGGTGDDILFGGANLDILIGGPGADIMDGGGAIRNFVSYATSTKNVAFSLETGLGTLGDALGDAATNVDGILGGKGNDTLVGDNASNQITGDAGNDELHGRGGGRDTLFGEAGNDVLFGEEGIDSLSGGLGNDKLFGGNGNDDITGDPGADFIDGGGDTDTVFYFNDSTGIVIDVDHTAKSTGDAKGDTYTAIESIHGSNYDDTLIAGATPIDLHGDYGNDTVIGALGADNLFGGELDDKLDGGAGDDKLDGGTGNDILIGGAGADVLDGGGDVDYASYATATAFVAADVKFGGLAGDAVGDTFLNIEGLIGSIFADTFFGDATANVFFGGAGNDTLFGLGGDDRLIGGGGADALDGGSDTDTASYAAAVTINLVDTTKGTGDAKGDTYTSIEIIEGSAFADTFIGDAGANTFNGGLGNDKISGGGDLDTLNGEDGNDTILGEAGNDVLHGGTGLDKLDGGIGLDSLFGDDGNDTLFGGDDADNLHGGKDDDKLDGGNGADQLFGDDGKDTLAGGAGDDQLDGGIGNDTLLGGAGNDLLIGGRGDNVMTGGDGADTFVSSQINQQGSNKVTDFDPDEDFLTLANVFGGAGLQDAIDAGITAETSGSTLTIERNGVAELVVSGWTGGEVNGDIQTVALILGSHLLITA